ncbi:hypothetical protein BDA96_02G090200 [Sorghum bicolor]|uniref:Uncharacterized protein n=2 Tax=Sorghum bicolor TaxID=4558 RepID=A0A921RMN6_SORBI|nr:hypothetical protein BDA96_02G090200 [Sorghum bicolor]KXG34754.1 hypothetical protein SORBI_3002G086700 [Sorghum bicolor]
MLETGAPGVAVLASHLRRPLGSLGPLRPLSQEPRGLGTSSWEAVVSPSSGGRRVCTHRGRSTNAGVAGSPVRDVTAAEQRPEGGGAARQRGAERRWLCPCSSPAAVIAGVDGWVRRLDLKDDTCDH